VTIPGTTIDVPVFVALLLALAARQPPDVTNDPKYSRPIDLAKCGLKVVEIEKVDQLQLDAKTKLVPSRKKARLVLIHLKGTSPEIGRITSYPPSFGVHYRGEESLACSAAKGLGLRSKTSDGKPHESWIHKTDDTTNIIVQSPGDEISFWVAVEVPENVPELSVQIPTMIPDAVQMPPARAAAKVDPPVTARGD